MFDDSLNITICDTSYNYRDYPDHVWCIIHILHTVYDLTWIEPDDHPITYVGNKLIKISDTTHYIEEYYRLECDKEPEFCIILGSYPDKGIIVKLPIRTYTISTKHYLN